MSDEREPGRGPWLAIGEEMQDYPDPKKYISDYVSKAADRYIDGLQKVGLKPSPILARVLAERAIQEAEERYHQEADDILEHNIATIINTHKKRKSQIRRQGARWSWFVCLPMMNLFGFLAGYYCFSQTNIPLGIVYGVAALVFVVMLVWAHRGNTER